MAADEDDWQEWLHFLAQVMDPLNEDAEEDEGRTRFRSLRGAGDEDEEEGPS